MLESLVKNIDRLFSYTEYRAFVKELLAVGKSTGPNQSESLLGYSELNEKRISRLEKTIKLSETTINAIKNNIKTKQNWIVVTESWCGDAAQSLPVLHKMAQENDLINFKVVLRDYNLPLIDAFLTNGGRSIPKLIVFDDAYNLIGSWGPRPSVATQMVNAYKEEHGGLDADFKKDLQVWYNKDKGNNIQEDIVALIS